MPDALPSTAPGQGAAPGCASRLGLGTVQLGLRYGVAHAGPRPTRREALGVIHRAAALGVGTLDTAPRYGAAEDVVGAHPDRGRFRIVTKTGPEEGGPGCIERGVERSLGRLGVDRVHGLLEHDASRLLGPGGDDRWRAMERVRAGGRAARIGASVYGPEELIELLERYPLGIVQAPLNALDRRMLDSGALERLAGLGVEVHLRSALLQGALAARPESLAANPALARAVAAFHARCGESALTPLEAALGFVLDAAPEALVVVGAQSAAQLDELVSAGDRALARANSEGASGGTGSDDPDVYDPRRWTVLA